MSNSTEQAKAYIILVNLGYGEQYAVKCPPNADNPDGRVIPCANRATAVTLLRTGVCNNNS